MAARSRKTSTKRERRPSGLEFHPEPEADPLLTEAPTMILDDEEEVHDLGFIIEDRTDNRLDPLTPYQRLDDLDTDEALETDPDGPLPAEARSALADGVPDGWHLVDENEENAAAEQDEEEFADTNQLLPDPYEEDLTSVPGDGEDDGFPDVIGTPSDPSRTEDVAPDAVGLRGQVPGVVRGLGTSLPQDVGAGGFSIRDNPLSTAAEELDDPISTEPLSDEALGTRDVDEMGDEEELDRLADRGARLEEQRTAAPSGRNRKRRAR